MNIYLLIAVAGLAVIAIALGSRWILTKQARGRGRAEAEGDLFKEAIRRYRKGDKEMAKPVPLGQRLVDRLRKRSGGDSA